MYAACNHPQEDITHIFFQYPIIKDFWDNIFLKDNKVNNLSLEKLLPEN